MRRLTVFSVPLVLLLLVGCADQTTAPDLDLTVAFAKPPKPPKPPKPEDPPDDPLVFISVETSVHPLAGSFTCAVEDADGYGVGPVYCWGVNSHMSLGLGGRKSRPKTEPTDPVSGGTLHFSEVHLGNQFACAIEDGDANGSGPIYCWGWNEYGQLGAEVTGDQSSPVPIASDLEFFDLDVGTMGACALVEQGTDTGPMYCWPSPPSSVPTQVAVGMEFAGFATDIASTCGIAGDGTAWCWEFGGSPVQIDGTIVFSALAVENWGFCGLNSNGQILCWNAREENEEVVYSEPVQMDLGSGQAANEAFFTAISPGFCALGASDQAYCWGANEYGQIGNGTVSGDPWSGWVEVPTPVGSPGQFRQISDKKFHTCGIGSDGLAYCWGANDTGALGDGTKTDSAFPVKVAGQ
jgi:hypothetical protein